MVYYLEIAEKVIKINLSRDLYLYEEWQRVIESTWGDVFLISKKASDYVINLNGPKMGLRQRGEGKLEGSIQLPQGKGKRIYFNNLFNFGLLLIVIRQLIIEAMAEKKFLVIHASGIIKDNKAILISGKSGSGKTTALRKLFDNFAVLGDDSIILQRKGNRVWAWPSPLNNKVSPTKYCRRSYPVGAVVTINKNRRKTLKMLDANKSVLLLIDQTRSILNSQAMSKLSFSYYRLLAKKAYQLSYFKEDPLIGLINKIEL